MKTGNGNLKSFLASVQASQALAVFADCYTISILTPPSIAPTPYNQNTNGTNSSYSFTSFYFTNASVNVSDGNNTFIANSILVDGLKYKCQTGLDVDQQTITISARSTDTVSFSGQLTAIPWLQAIANGILDGALIQRKRVFFDGWTTMNYQGDVILFQGRVADIHEIGRTHAEITVDSDLTLLDLQMPRNLFSPQCVHVLYDSGCKLTRSAYTAEGTVGLSSTGASSTQTVIYASLTNQANYQQGAIYFLSGANAGATRTVSFANSTQLTLAYPLNNPVSSIAPFDTFSISQGCDHTMNTCLNKFNNEKHFRGFPFIPDAMTAFSG